MAVLVRGRRAEAIAAIAALAAFISSHFLAECTHLDCPDLPPDSEIVQCSVVYRHGDRTPISEYPKSKYFHYTYWIYGWGQLTKKGMKQHLRFGRWLMQRYGPLGLNLILPIYNVSEYQVVSTDLDRTIMSGQSNSAGIFHPMPGEEIDKKIQWRPVSIRAISADERDTIFAQFCPLVDETLIKLRKIRFELMRKENPELVEYAEKYSGYGMEKDPQRMFWLYDTLTCENSTYHEIPEWAEPIYPEILKTFYMEFISHYAFTKKMKKLTGGPLLKNILETMTNKTIGVGNIKLYSYSAHDTTIYSVLTALGIDVKEPPAYTSAIFFELFKSPGLAFFIRVLYRHGPDSEPEPLLVPGCHVYLCPLEKFKEITAPMIPGDIQKECKAESPEISDLAKNPVRFMRHHSVSAAYWKYLPDVSGPVLGPSSGYEDGLSTGPEMSGRYFQYAAET